MHSRHVGGPWPSLPFWSLSTGPAWSLLSCAAHCGALTFAFRRSLGNLYFPSILLRIICLGIELVRGTLGFFTARHSFSLSPFFSAILLRVRHVLLSTPWSPPFVLTKRITEPSCPLESIIARAWLRIFVSPIVAFDVMAVSAGMMFLQPTQISRCTPRLTHSFSAPCSGSTTAGSYERGHTVVHSVRTGSVIRTPSRAHTVHCNSDQGLSPLMPSCPSLSLRHNYHIRETRPQFLSVRFIGMPDAGIRRHASVASGSEVSCFVRVTLHRRE